MTDQQTDLTHHKTPLEWFQFIQDITDKLTLRRIFNVVALGILGTIALLTYENRATLFDIVVSKLHTVDSQAAWVVSDDTKNTLNSLTDTNPLVGFTLISEVDLKQNKKTPRYWKLDAMAGEQSDLINKRAANMLPQAMFDYDAKNTQQMVAVLNNEFACARFTDTLYNKLFPDLEPKFPVICRIAIPPFYGRFVGMMTLGLTMNPSKEEMDSLRIEAARIAVEIYLRDVLHKTR